MWRCLIIDSNFFIPTKIFTKKIYALLNTNSNLLILINLIGIYVIHSIDCNTSLSRSHGHCYSINCHYATQFKHSIYTCIHLTLIEQAWNLFWIFTTEKKKCWKKYRIVRMEQFNVHVPRSWECERVQMCSRICHLIVYIYKLITVPMLFFLFIWRIHTANMIHDNNSNFYTHF